MLRQRLAAFMGLPIGRAPGAPFASLQRLQSQALTQQASVHTVRWNGEDFLLACTPQQVTLLARTRAGQDAGATP